MKNLSEIVDGEDIITKEYLDDKGYMQGMTILSYGNSTWQDFINAYSSNKVVYCRASSNSNPASGSQTRLAFMAYVSNETTPTNVEFQYYRSVSSHTASQQGDQVYVYKLTNAGAWSVIVREASVKVAAGGDLTGSYSNGTFTVSGTMPTVPTSAGSATTGVTVADHSSTTIYGVQSSTTSVTGVQSSTTTASKVTLGTAISVPNVTAAGSGSFTQGSFSGGSFTQGTDSFTPNSPTVINASAFGGGSFTRGSLSGGSGSFTQGSFSGGSLTMSMDSTDTKKLNITFTAATHGADSFTPASLGESFYQEGTSASFTQGEDSFTPATHGADSHTHTPPTLGTAKSIPNVTGVSDVTVPIKNTSATTVPIKNSSTTTVVTSKTHTITDNGHTHSLS